MISLNSLANLYKIQVEVGKRYRFAKKHNNKELMKQCEAFFKQLPETYKILYKMEQQKERIK